MAFVPNKQDNQNSPAGQSGQTDATQPVAPPYGNTAAPLPPEDNYWIPTPQFGGTMYGMVTPMNEGSEVFKLMSEKLKKKYEKPADPRWDIKLLELDRSIYSDLLFSALIVAVSLADRPKQGVAYHILLIEGTGTKFEAYKDTVRDGYNNREVEFQAPTELALDKELVETAYQVMAKSYPNATLRFAGHTVLPTDFDIESDESIRRLAALISVAASSELISSLPTFTDLNITKLVPAGQKLMIDISFDNQAVQNFVNHPVRSNVQVAFKANRKSENRAARGNRPPQDWVASRIHGFLDLVPAPNGGTVNTPYGPMRTPPYVGRFIGTQVECGVSMTLGGVLMAMSTVFVMGASESWVQGFSPRQTRPGELDLTDIGPLNVDANINNEPTQFGSPIIDTKNADFGLSDVGKLMGMYVHKGLIFTFDCSIAGPDSFFLSPLRAAEHPAARKIILSSWDELTNHNFRKYFKEEMRITSGANELIHLGHWFDSQRVKRDIRDFDLTAVACYFGRTEPRMIREWQSTFYDRDTPREILMSKRWDMIRAMSNDTAVCTGMAERVTFTRDVVSAAMAAMHDTKIEVNVKTPLNSSEFNYQRPTAGFVADALVTGVQGFHAPSYGAAGTGYAPSNFRWS